MSRTLQTEKEQQGYRHGDRLQKSETPGIARSYSAIVGKSGQETGQLVRQSDKSLQSEKSHPTPTEDR